MTVASDLDALALDRLRALTGRDDAGFRDGQLEAVRDLVADRARVLCVQRTGWGKSAVYFVATSLLRAQGAGPTLIVSPLLALMRNQLAAAGGLGLSAHTINSTNREDWDVVRDRLAADDVDLLLISPERLNNPRFREELLPLFAERVGLLVIDEAHCISDWGHDFRPDYRRVRDVLDRLPEQVAVLATTATANDRVVGDVLEQLGTGRDAGVLRSYRGPLGRDSLRLEVVDLPRPAERLAWLATVVPRLEGSGIVYTLTVRDAERVADWLVSQGVDAVAYSGEAPPEAREAVERRLLADEVKAVVATSALGMGYDKPDLRWVVHFQAPGSVVSYYQQVGRAGRAVPQADVVLLRGAEDEAIQSFFIEQAFPPREVVERVLGALEGAGDGGATTRELQGVVNLGAGRIDALLKVLDVEGAVTRDGTRWRVVPRSGWQLDEERQRTVTALRREEQRAMRAYGADGRCLMRILRAELDDPGAEDCGRCAVCTEPRFAIEVDPALAEAAGRFMRDRPHSFEPKKMAPDPSGAMRKIPADVLTDTGWAPARMGDGGWWPAVSRALAEGRAESELVAALADLARRGAGAPAWVAWVPSRAHGAALGTIAGQVAAALGVPLLDLVARVADRPPQRDMANAVQQAANVRGAFRIASAPPPGPGVLIDDRRFSGWTLAMVGGQLRKAGAERVVPLALGVAY